MKRTTGIPRSFLTKIEKPIALANDGTIDDTKPPTGAMVNADGEWVVAEPDKASWEQYHAKVQVSAAAQEVAARGSKELQDKGLECSIDKRLFIEPTLTPCCQTTYCLECITDALLENDLQCPACSTDDILIDDLKPDNEKVAAIQKYKEEKNAANVREESPKSPKEFSQLAQQKSSPSPKTGTLSPVSDRCSKKRPADSELKNDRSTPGKSATDTKLSNVNGTYAKLPNQCVKAGQKLPSNNQLPLPAGNFMFQSLDSMTFPTSNGFPGMPMTMAPTMGMGSAIFDPVMQNASMMSESNGSWNAMWGGGFPQPNLNLQGAGVSNGIMLNGSYAQQNMHVPTNYGLMGNGMRLNSQGTGSFTNQQRNFFCAPTQNEEDSAYFRKPVNPYRHQARRNVNRPTDYREI